MGKSNFEMKVEQAIKPIEEIIEKLVSCTNAELSKGIENIDSDEFGKVSDSIKDYCEAKEKIVKALYYTEIGKAMEENADDYGDTWDENGKKYYGDRMRDSMGRFMYTEQFQPYMNRDMDRSNGRMYYTEPEKMTTTDSRFEMAKRNYTESKMLHSDMTNDSDNMKNAKEAGKWIDEIASEIKPMIPSMHMQEKTTIKNKLMEIVNAM